VHITLHWQCAPGFTDASWQSRLRRFIDKLKRWVARRGIPYALAWINENGFEYGQHTHVMLHLPHPKGAEGKTAFRATVAELEAWIIETENLAIDKVDRFGKPWSPVMITGGPIGMRTRKRRAGLCRYLLKSLDPNDVAYTGAGAEPRAAILNVEPRHRARPLPSGVRRFRASRNLGIAARRAAGWRELVSIEELRDRLNPA
jgi:hypothetical protein